MFNIGPNFFVLCLLLFQNLEMDYNNLRALVNAHSLQHVEHAVVLWERHGEASVQVFLQDSFTISRNPSICKSTRISSKSKFKDRLLTTT